jgi:hypothetical protein
MSVMSLIAFFFSVLIQGHANDAILVQLLERSVWKSSRVFALGRDRDGRDEGCRIDARATGRSSAEPVAGMFETP